MGWWGEAEEQGYCSGADSPPSFSLPILVLRHLHKTVLQNGHKNHFIILMSLISHKSIDGARNSFIFIGFIPATVCLDPVSFRLTNNKCMKKYDCLE